MSHWTYSDTVRQGIVFAENRAHHGPTGRWVAVAWRAGTDRTGAEYEVSFDTREEGLVYVERWGSLS